MLHKRQYSIYQHLAAFGAALLFPVVMLVGLALWEFAKAEQQQNQQKAQAAAEQIIADIDQALAALSETRPLATGLRA